MFAAGHLRRNWIVANVLGELLGLGLAAVVASGIAQAGALPPAVSIVLAATAFLVVGAYEGAIVGAAQWMVLRRTLPLLRASSWLGATAAGAIVAWSLAHIVSADAARSGGGLAAEPNAWLMIPLSVAAGAALGAILGIAQWLVLSDHARRAWVWIGANAVAWAAGMPLVFLVAGRVGPQTPPLAVGLLILGAVIAAGAVAGAIEAVYLRRILGAV